MEMGLLPDGDEVVRGWLDGFVPPQTLKLLRA